MQVFTSLIVLGLCSAVFVISDVKSYKGQKIESSSAIAQVVGSNSVSSLYFYDNETAQRKLAELRIKPDILNAVIFDKQGDIFASYTKEGADTFQFSSSIQKDKKFEFAGHSLFIYNNIIKDNEILGKLSLQIDVAELNEIINNKLRVAFLLLILGITLALIIAAFIQRGISTPLSDLVNVMEKVKESDDYTNRSIIKGKDEINTLSRAFNDMLEKIENREGKLKERTNELGESEARLRQLIETAPDAVIMIDEKGIITDWNKQAETMFGWIEAEVTGKTFPETIIPERYHEAHIKGLKYFLKTGESPVLNKPLELSGLRKDNTEFPIELKISASKIKEKYVFVGFISDITERKKNEEKINQLNKNLEQNIVQIENTNKELESFSYSVSHDLRAPIRAINGFSKIVEKKYGPQFDEEGKDLLNTITKESIKMGQLIDDLLAFSRLGKKEIEKTTVDMTALAKEVVDEVLKLSEEKYKAKISVGNLLPSACDKTLIRQVFVNLLSNALKFSHTKPNPVIEIDSKDENDAVVYYVKDNGVGFDMKFYDKLFGVFQRLHSPEEFTGTGIGLAIVKRIIIRHGGKVWAEGKVNEGATFYFSLPKGKTGIII
ncbi:MAG: PAS domain S-box protein [Bacteroidota bacterium]